MILAGIGAGAKIINDASLNSLKAQDAGGGLNFSDPLQVTLFSLLAIFELALIIIGIKLYLKEE